MVLPKPSFNDYRPDVILAPQNRLGSLERKTLDIGQELQMWERVMSSRSKSKEEAPHNLTPKSVEDMATDVLENNKTVEMF
jgi:hypothetical protein